jgi:tetratricopeptide (TPR) repeat protein
MANTPHLRAVSSAEKQPDRKLESWKEIAAYLNRTTRTARRWEQTENLPVHRHSHSKRDSVFAHTSEIDEWWKSRQARLERIEGEPEPEGEDSVLEPAAGTHLQWPWMALGIAILVAFLSAGGWHFWSLRRPVVSFVERDWILVTDFSNQTGDPVFEKSLWTAFTVSLQQSKYANTLPRTRIDAALKRMGKNGETRIDEAVGREICLRENIKQLVVCDIGKIGQQFSISARLVDPHTGASVRSYIERAGSQEAVLDCLGRMASSLRKDLGESLAGIRQSDQSLPRVTTPSLQALELYAEGAHLWRKGAYQEAVKLYEAALAHDADFSMARASLGAAYCSNIYNDVAKGKEHYQRALEHSDRVTDRERLIIQAGYERDMGHFEEAVRLHKTYLAAYPDDATFRYSFGTLLMRNRRPEEAVNQLKEAVRVAPNYASAFLNLATSYKTMGRSDQALTYYAKAFELEPGLLSIANISDEYGFTLLHSGNIAKARETFELASANPDLKASGLRSLALVDMYEGKYRDAKARLEEAMRISEARQDALRQTRTHLFMAILMSGQGNRQGCVREVERAKQDLESLRNPPNWMMARIGVAFARAGALGPAEEILRYINARVDLKNSQENSFLHLLKGEVELARGHGAIAVEMLLRSDSEAGTAETLSSLANAYKKNGNVEQAIGCYQKLLALHLESLGWEPQQAWIEAHVRLAELYMAQRETAKAAQALDPLIALWKNADTDLPLAKRISALRIQLESKAI